MSDADTQGRPESVSSTPFTLEDLPVPAKRRREWRRVLWLIPVVVLAFVVFTVRLPYFIFSPGPTEDVLGLVKITGATTYPAHGQLLLTTVNFREATPAAILAAWLSPTESVVPEDQVLAPGQSLQQNIQQQQEVMSTSQIDAQIAVFSRYEQYPDRHGTGVLVEDVGSGTPAEGKLVPGNVITQVNGRPVDDPAAVGDVIQGTAVGSPIRFTVQASTGTKDVSIAPANVQGVDHPIVGVVLVHTFTLAVSFRSGDIGGPSAGLMWALGLVDLLTPGDLTGGHVISGTGTISPDGTVGPIGGVQEKVAGAERGGATVFFVPLQDAKDARSVAGDITVVPVSTYQQAVRYLQTHG
jgi:PDZ domain-containing protein